MNFELLVSPSKEAQDAVLTPLIAYNAQFVGMSGKTELTFHVRNDDGPIIAGANGFTHWNYFFLAHLWISDEERGKGLGRRLMKQIEDAAIERNCTHLWLDTFTFQAAGFYEKLGYVRVGELPDYPIGHRRFFYTKKLETT